jgi:biopolymer transport protein ExbD
MMGRFKRSASGRSAGISTASLPDIIFILLFFFMVTTVLRDKEMLVRTKLPQATEVEKLEKKSLVSFIYMGPPVRQDIWGTTPRIQLNDQFARPDDIATFVTSERRKVDEVLIPQMTFSMKVDKDTRMGLVTDVKQELRKVNALKINYSTLVRADQ